MKKIRNYKEALITLTIGLILVVVAVIIVNVLLQKRYECRGEADAVERLIEKWADCGNYPKVKIDVVKKVFIFNCP